MTDYLGVPKGSSRATSYGRITSPPKAPRPTVSKTAAIPDNTTSIAVGPSSRSTAAQGATLAPPKDEISKKASHEDLAKAQEHLRALRHSVSKGRMLTVNVPTSPLKSKDKPLPTNYSPTRNTGSTVGMGKIPVLMEEEEDKAGVKSGMAAMKFEIQKLKTELQESNKLYQQKVEECNNLKGTELKLEQEIDRLKIELSDYKLEVEGKAVISRRNTERPNTNNPLIHRKLDLHEGGGHELSRSGTERRRGSTGGLEGADDVKVWKKKYIILQKRLQNETSQREQLIEKVQTLEQENCETSRVLEMAELSYQLLQSKTDRLSEEVDFYKQELKEQADHFSELLESNSADLSSIADLKEKNAALEEQVKELQKVLESEKTEKHVVIKDLKSKIDILEKKSVTALADSPSLTSTPRTPSTPSSAVTVDKVASLLEKIQQTTELEELTNLKLDVATKNRKIQNLEQELKDYQEKTQILAEQLNRICDEVERSEQLYHRVEDLTSENENLRQEISFLTADLEALKDDIHSKEQEIEVFIEDNDKLVGKLTSLGFQVKVDETGKLEIVEEKKVTNTIENLKGLTIDELLNG